MGGILVGLGQADAHRDTHPEQLRRLQAHMLLAGLVADQIAVIQRLQTKEIEVQVRCRIKRPSEPVEVVVQQRARRCA